MANKNKCLKCLKHNNQDKEIFTVKNLDNKKQVEIQRKINNYMKKLEQKIKKENEFMKAVDKEDLEAFFENYKALFGDLD